MEGWIKLHRKALESEVFRDHTAWVIFCWLLLRADRKTGKTTLGRKWAAKELGIKETTFYKALKRLENTYKMVILVTRKVTIKFTEIEIINWYKYQIGDKPSNNPVTIKGQSSNNPVTHIQEVENRELKNEEDNAPQNFKKKKTNPLILSKGQQMFYLKAFPTLSSSELKAEIDKCNTYMGMSSEQYRNPGLFLKKWLTRYMVERGQKRASEKKVLDEQKALEGLPEEERVKNIERLNQIRKELATKLTI